MSACRWAASRFTAESGLSMAGGLAPAAPAAPPASCRPRTAAAAASPSSSCPSPSASSPPSSPPSLLLLAVSVRRVYAASRPTPASVTPTHRDRSTRLHAAGARRGLGLGAASAGLGPAWPARSAASQPHARPGLAPSAWHARHSSRRSSVRLAPACCMAQRRRGARSTAVRVSWGLGRGPWQRT